MFLFVYFEIDPEWLLDKISYSPVDEIIQVLSEKFHVVNKESHVTEGKVWIGSLFEEPLPDEMEVKKVITDFFQDSFAISENELEESVSISFKMEEEPDTPDTEEEKEEPERDFPERTEENLKADSDEKSKPSIVSQKKFEKLKSEKSMLATERYKMLVGAEEMKAFVEECISIAPGVREHHTQDIFAAQCYLFSINDGYGFTTYVNLLSDLFDELELVERIGSQSVNIVEAYLDVNPGEKEEKVGDKILALFRESLSQEIICLDISEWMSTIRDIQFRKFLHAVNEKRGKKQILIFRIPFVEKNVLRDIQRELQNIWTVRTISIPPFGSNELNEIAQHSFMEKGFSLEEEAWTPFQDKLREEKSDGRFYGINTVNKVVNQVLYSKHINDARGNISDWMVRKEDVLRTLSREKSLQGGIEELDSLVGMEKIKERVLEIVAQIEAARQNDKLESPCIHMCFMGHPGTGKTTVARIIGNVLKERGVLRNGAFFEYTGRDLCGRYIGETTPKTRAICREAYGSVLFIDEAYALYHSGESERDYGKEALTALVSEMENHRTDLLVIMAGYEEEMEDMMTANPGLKSRIPYRIDFPNYTREQLAQIYMNMAESRFQLGEGLEQAVKEYFDKLSDEILEAKDFGNGRYVRDLYERTWGKAASRAIPCNTLTKDDFLQACADSEFLSQSKYQKRPIGY